MEVTNTFISVTAPLSGRFRLEPKSLFSLPLHPPASLLGQVRRAWISGTATNVNRKGARNYVFPLSSCEMKYAWAASKGNHQHSKNRRKPGAVAV